MSKASKQHFTLPPEQQAIRDKCFHPSGEFVEFPIEDVETSIPGRFEKMVYRYPDRLAVKMGDYALTYNRLNQAANRIAWSICRVRGASVEPVVLIAQHGTNAIASCLGILKAGKILVVIDPAFPFEKVAYIFENSQAGAIVTDSNSLSYAKVLAQAGQQIVNVDALNSTMPQTNLGLQIAPDAIAQIVYSSGSTGQSKGIFFNHRRVLHDVMVFVNLLHICPDDRFIQARKLSFGAGIKDLFRAVLSGASVFPYEINSEALSSLEEFLNREGITIFSPGVSVFRHFVNQLNGTERFGLIRMILLGGQSISRDDVAAYKTFFHHNCGLFYHLSGSEAGLICHYFIDKKTDLRSATVPVGYAAEGKEIILLDENGRVQHRGEVGEIAVRSRYLSSGYWRNPVLTDAKFLPDTDGVGEKICLTGDLGQMTSLGCLTHLGRNDFVVKIRGYRVDMMEVERALLAHPKVKDTGVVAWDQKSGEKYLVGYVVARHAPPPTTSELREFLRKDLPDYMIPSVFIFLDSLPVTNTKLDRKALPKPAESRPELCQLYVDPRNQAEQNVVKIWEAILNVHPIGIDDNFFDLGGHSLAASRVISQIIQEFNLKLPVKALFDAPTVAEMAVVIEQHQHKQATDVELARMLSEVEAMTDFEAQQQLTRTDGK